MITLMGMILYWKT